MTEIEAQTIGKRGRHPELGERFALSGGRVTEHRSTVEESKDETPPKTLEWKEDTDDE